MENLVIISNEKAYGLAKNLSRYLNVESAVVEQRVFPDGEIYLRIPIDVKHKTSVLLWSIKGDINNDVLSLMLALDATWELGAERILSVIPYMPYARQDSRFKDGEAVSIVTLSKIFRFLTADYIITVDMHLHRIEEPRIIFGDRFVNISGIESIASYISNRTFERGETVVVGPDEESIQWASRLGDLLKIPWMVLEKERHTAEDVEVKVKESLPIEVKRAIIIDDIISTGGTIESTVKLLKSIGIPDIYVYCVHPVLSPTSLYRLESLKLSDLACTNTLPSPISYIDISRTIGDAIKRIL